MCESEQFSGYEELSQRFMALPPGEDCLFVNARYCASEGEFVERIAGCGWAAFDFDGTLMVENVWDHLRACMASAHCEVCEANSAEYWNGGVGTLLALADLLLVPVGFMHGWDRELIKRVATYLPVREGAIDLMRSFAPHEVAIISFGIYDMILEWLKLHATPQEVEAWSIFALRLQWHTNVRETIAGYDLATAVTEDKAYRLANFLSHRRGSLERTLVVGDSHSDIDMMKGCVGVGIIPHNDSPDRKRGRIAKALPEFAEHAMAVLVSDSLAPIGRLRNPTPAEIRRYSN